MNPFTMVVALVAIVAVASVIRAAVGGRRNNGLMRLAGEIGETTMLRDEIDDLRERVERLERALAERQAGA